VELNFGNLIYSVSQPFIPSARTQGPKYLLAERSYQGIHIISS
jgi:hypothetical protein